MSLVAIWSFLNIQRLGEAKGLKRDFDFEYLFLQLQPPTLFLE